MLIIGCDYHPSVQQIAFVDTDTGELRERRLGHREEAEQFYRELSMFGLGDLRLLWTMSGPGIHHITGVIYWASAR